MAYVLCLIAISLGQSHLPNSPVQGFSTKNALPGSPTVHFQTKMPSREPQHHTFLRKMLCRTSRQVIFKQNCLSGRFKPGFSTKFMNNN